MAHNNWNDWNDWHYVIAVVERGSLSAAARYLGVNHATVLRRIAKFEDLHGVKFFERRQNGYAPTSECQEIFGRMRHLENSVHELEAAVKNLGNPYTGRVGITSTDTICQYILPKHIKRLNTLHPGLKIELSSTNLRLDLTSLDAEITIRPTSNLPADLIGRRACNIAIEVYGSPDYLAENPSGDPGDHAWLCLVDTPTPTPMKTWEADNNLTNVVFRSDSFVSLCHAAENGMGLAMMPSLIGNASARLIKAKQFSTRLTNGVWIASHRDRSGSARIKTLLDFFFDAMVSDKDILEGKVKPNHQALPV